MNHAFQRVLYAPYIINQVIKSRENCAPNKNNDVRWQMLNMHSIKEMVSLFTFIFSLLQKHSLTIIYQFYQWNINFTK